MKGYPTTRSPSSRSTWSRSPSSFQARILFFQNLRVTSSSASWTITSLIFTTKSSDHQKSNECLSPNRYCQGWFVSFKFQYSWSTITIIFYTDVSCPNSKISRRPQDPILVNNISIQIIQKDREKRRTRRDATSLTTQSSRTPAKTTSENVDRLPIFLCVSLQTV